MSMQLVVTAGADQGRLFPLQDGGQLVIGRGQDTGTQLRDPRISRSHCRIAVDAGKAVLTDDGGAGGTFVNNEQVAERELQPGDIIQIGDTQFRFQLDEEPDESTMYTPAAGATAAKPAASQDLADLVGKDLHHYHIEKIIAKGNTGTVFFSKHTEDGRVVALKVLWPEISKNEEEMHRFIRAMKTTLPIRHPNLIAIYNAGRTGSYCWIAMEYVDGESMTEVIGRIGTAGMLDWRYAFRVAVHIARGLQAAFEHKIIHRNITPQNILLRSSDKTAKLGDLMLAKALEATESEQITRPGQLIGDVAYMPPERTRSSDEVDCRSDIYSLGATAYALLAGRPPFEGGSLPELISRIRSEEPVKPKEFQLSIPDMFEGLVLKMLAKRPDDRHQDPTDLLEDLERVGKFQGVEV